MRAIVRTRYGSPDVLEIRDVEMPDVPDDAVLVHVRAASVNPLNWYEMTGTPLIGRPTFGFFKPKSERLGTDFAGTVETIGKDVTHVRPGDEVFGGRDGALAEYVSVRNAVARKPSNASFEEAAAVPIAALTALQGLRDKGGIRAGQQVLINGASGGVGTYAVQIAKAFGATVTAVCSTRNVETARSNGADRVVDYTREDFTDTDRRYDVMLDFAGSRRWRECRRVLTPDATVVVAGAPKGGRLFGPLRHMIPTRIAALRSSQSLVNFTAKLRREDLDVMRELMEAGKVRSVIDKRYDFAQTADAFRYLAEGHARGKVVVTM